MNETTCPLCKCSMKDNSHGLDQNDLYEDEEGEFKHIGRCTYCRFCNPVVDHILKKDS